MELQVRWVANTATQSVKSGSEKNNKYQEPRVCCRNTGYFSYPNYSSGLEAEGIYISNFD